MRLIRSDRLAVLGGAALMVLILAGIPLVVATNQTPEGQPDSVTGDSGDHLRESRSALPAGELVPELARHVREAFQLNDKEVPWSFVGDAQLQQLAPTEYSSASFATVEFDSEAHVYGMSVLYSQSESEGDLGDICQSDESWDASCVVRPVDGRSAVLRVRTFRFVEGTLDRRLAVAPKDLDRFASELWFRYDIEIVDDRGQITSAFEDVHATTIQEADALRRSTWTTLESLVTHGELTMKEPVQ